MTNGVARTLLQNPDFAVRRTAIEELKQDAQLPGAQDGTIEILVAALSDAHVAVQDAAIHSLMDFKPERVVIHVLPLLHAAVHLRSLAIEVLQQLAAPAVVPILHAAADSDPHIRKIIADILGHIRGPRAVDGLLGLLNDSCPNVRSAAAESLGNLGDSRAAVPLIALLQDPEEWVVFSAINALGNLGDDQALPALLDLLTSDVSALQDAVVEALGKIGNPECLPDLLEILPMARLPLRHLLFVTIVKLVGEDSWVFRQEELQEFLFAELVGALKSRESEVQLAALQGLRLLGNSRATVALLQFLTCQQFMEDKIHAAVLDALTEIGEESQLIESAKNQDERIALFCIQALSGRCASLAVPALGELVVRSENREVRRAALVALERIGIQGVESSVMMALQDQSGYIRAEAARLVGMHGIQKAGAVLEAQIEVEPYPDVVQEQVRAMVALSGPHSLQTLERLLGHPRVEVREAVVANWSTPLDQPDLALLIRHLGDSEWRVRLQIVDRLSTVQDESIFEILVTSSTDVHPHIRQSAVQALGRYSGPRTLSILRKVAAEDPDVWVRSRAVEQLAAIQDSSIVPFFIELLEEAPPLLKLAVAEALGTLKDRSAIEPLSRLQFVEEPELQRVVNHALAQLHEPQASEGVVL
ncbi:HEAT repeat domain-containing protein [Candidatus Nitronereus thalassa]|uniref:HEAT repeat domain-containing protein n=1 Tax=Candidatus Nitronereus thalassa TaxID=3020898 RepID=A0ABU3K664_9BACT|nr:HEAT repeat domain-containing protein [Candidatus Nitronereus thalassa]MDT7041883.1 HEAT repeat domain-containing protein [Candidatus Nitronereus thalassa]